MNEHEDIHGASSTASAEDLAEFGFSEEDISGMGEVSEPIQDSVDEVGVTLDELMGKASDSERLIPLAQRLEAVQYYLEQKKKEIAEYEEVLSEYSKLHMVDTSWKLADNLTDGVGDAAMNALMSMMVDSQGLSIDVDSASGRHNAAVQLSIFTVLQSRSNIEDITAAKNLQVLYEAQSNSEELFEQLMLHPNILRVYHKWLKALDSIVKINTASHTAINTKQFREMQEVSTRLAKEKQVIEAANEELRRVTYPVYIDTVSGSSGSKYMFVCGECQESVDVGMPFYEIRLLDAGTVQIYQNSGTPPKKLEALCISHRIHQCPHCGSYNMMPKVFAEKLQEEVFEHVRSGSLNAKTRDMFTMGRATVSQATMRKVRETIISGAPEYGKFIPESSSSVEESVEPVIEIQEVLSNLQYYKSNFLRDIQGLSRRDVLSQDHDRRYYAYLQWLAANYSSKQLTIDDKQISLHLVNLIKGSPELSKFSTELRKLSMITYTAEKLCRVIDSLFEGIYGDELVSTGFIKEGLRVLEMQGVPNPIADWEEGLSISKKIRSTPRLEELRSWSESIQREYRSKLNAMKDRCNIYIRGNTGFAGVVETTNLGYSNAQSSFEEVSGFVLQGLFESVYETLVVNTVARMISNNWKFGVFLRGFGAPMVSCMEYNEGLKKIVSAARATLKKIAEELATDSLELSEVKKLQARLSGEGVRDDDVAAILLEGLKYIKSNERFQEITGIPVGYLKADKSFKTMGLPKESTVILGSMFTYNNEYSGMPSVILKYGVQQAGVYLLSLNMESANDEAVNAAISTVASEMVMYSPPSLWEENQERYAEIVEILELD